MVKLFILTLEPIDRRYTKQWYRYWKSSFNSYFNLVEYIDGETITDNIEKGRFLDINQTNIWKAIQIQKIAKMFYDGKIKKGDKFLFMDGWHPGITAVKYMSQLNNIDIEIYGYLHAGTWDKWDFISQAGLTPWAKYIEAGWFMAVNNMFVATKFHKKLIINRVKELKLSIRTSKIKVVGFPMDWKQAIKDEIKTLPTNSKLNTVVFPHRIDKEKNPVIFDKLAKKFPDYNFVKTMNETQNKEQYYYLLSRAKVSFSSSLQETFGIGTVEAMMLGAIPLVPERLSYPELYHPMFRYKDIKEAEQKIKYFVRYYYKDKLLNNALINNQDKIQNACMDAYKKMAEVMLNG